MFIFDVFLVLGAILIIFCSQIAFDEIIYYVAGYFFLLFVSCGTRQQ